MTASDMPVAMVVPPVGRTNGSHVEGAVTETLAVEGIGLAPASELAAKAVDKGILERIRIGCAGDGWSVKKAESLKAIRQAYIVCPRRRTLQVNGTDIKVVNYTQCGMKGWFIYTEW
jgi:hypothetical protein